MNRVAKSLTVVALLAAGGVAIATAPTDDTIVAPFLVRGDVGSRIDSRLATVVARDVTLARELDIDYGFDQMFDEVAPDSSSDGVWVVVDLDITTTYVAADFGNAEVRIGPVRYRASTILPDQDLQSFSFDPGITVRGSIVFELPASALRGAAASDALIVLAPRLSPVLDTVPTITVDLRALPVDDIAVIAEAGVVDSRAEDAG